MTRSHTKRWARDAQEIGSITGVESFDTGQERGVGVNSINKNRMCDEIRRIICLFHDRCDTGLNRLRTKSHGFEEILRTKCIQRPHRGVPPVVVMNRHQSSRSPRGSFNVRPVEPCISLNPRKPVERVRQLSRGPSLHCRMDLTAEQDSSLPVRYCVARGPTRHCPARYEPASPSGSITVRASLLGRRHRHGCEP